MAEHKHQWVVAASVFCKKETAHEDGMMVTKVADCSASEAEILRTTRLICADCGDEKIVKGPEPVKNEIPQIVVMYPGGGEK